MKILNAVIAYKDFEWNDLDEDSLNKFLVFTPNEIKTNIKHVCKYDEIDGYDNRIYGELSHHQFISKNIDFDWIVINQYRRRFELPDYGHIYVPKPLKFKESVKNVYSYFHNETDLDVMTDIVMESNIEDSFKIEWLKSLDDKTMICYNMFAGPKELYLEWLEICLGYLDTFKKIKRFTSYNEVLNNNLEVIDLSAINLCKDNKINLIVFNMDKENAIIDVANGVKIGTLIGEEK